MVLSASAMRALVEADETAISSRNTFFEFWLPKQIKFLYRKVIKIFILNDQSLKIRIELQGMEKRMHQTNRN